MSKFWSALVNTLVPYVPGEQPKINNLVKLNTNENPYGPSPKALAAMQSALNDDLRLYPDPNADLLKEAVARYYSVDKSMVFVGNGSDEVLAHIFHGLLKHEKPIVDDDHEFIGTLHACGTSLRTRDRSCGPGPRCGAG
jgi:histidinol-phosphate aminotransferase